MSVSSLEKPFLAIRYFLHFIITPVRKGSDGSKYQYWTPLTLPLIPLHSPSNHSLGSDPRIWVSERTEYSSYSTKLIAYFLIHILLIPACYPNGTVEVTHPASYSHCFAVQNQGLSSAVKCTVSTSGSVSLITGCSQVCTLVFDLTSFRINSHFTDRTWSSLNILSSDVWFTRDPLKCF